MSAPIRLPAIQPLVLMIGSDDLTNARRTAVSLKRNLNSTRVLKAVETRKMEDIVPSMERKSYAALLCSLSLQIVEGAAVKLIAEGILNGIKAAFASNKGKQLSIKLTIHGREISITAKNLTGKQMGALMKELETELTTL